MAKRPAAPKKPRKTPYPGEHHHRRRKPLTLCELQELIMAVAQTVTDALAAQDAKIADLSTKVDTFIATHQGNADADNAEIVNRVTAQGAAVDAIAAKLT